MMRRLPGAKIEMRGTKVKEQKNTGRVSWLRGAAVLGIAAVMSKLLGTMQKIPLQNLAGDGVFGIYNAVYPLYILILFLATAGFPATVSKFVSEKAALGDHYGALRVAKVSGILLMVTGLFFFGILYTCAADIAALIGVPAASNAIRSISFALLLVPSLSVMRGYFQGYQNMVPTAVSQVIEQVVRVITLVALLLYFLHAGFSDEWIAAGATFGSVTGAVGGLVAVCWFWRGQKKIFSTEWNRKGNLESNRESIWKLIKQITAYAIPICLGAIVMPILNLVDTFTIPRVLQLEGASISEAVRVFGLYNRGLPLVQAVVMIASAMTAVLVPAIAEARVRGRVDQVQSRTEFSVRLTWIIGLAASVGLAALSVPINIMLFRNSEASLTMAILAFTAVFSMMNVVTSSLLQGAGALYAPALHLLAATLIKVAGNLWLMPRYGINGAAAAAVLAYAAAAGLNIVQLKRCTGAAFALRDFAARPIAAVAAMTASLPLWVYGSIALCTLLPMKERVIYTVAALVGVLGGTAVYALALFRFRVLTRSDLHSVPALEKKLAPIMAKLNLLPEERRP